MKKTVAILLSILLITALFTGCGAGPKQTVTLKVWGSQEDQAMLTKMVDEFKAANKGKSYDITFGVVSEADAKTKVLEDPSAAADVFAFANDQIKDLVNAGALYEITRNKEKITSENMEGSIEASTVDGKLYAYPETADNGYFMYYDKSVFSADDVKSLDKMLEVANAKGKKVFMDVSNGWYIASFFLGAGGTLTVGEDGNQKCDFNNDNGVKAGEAIKAFTADPAFLTGDDAVLKGGIGGEIAAGVSGTWNAEDIKSILGDNYAATKLPTFTLGSEQVQMGSFAGYKLVGISSQTKFPVDAMDLGEWLTNEKNQITRFETRAMGPSNKKAASSDAVKANVALAALAEQNQFATSQKDVLGTYWAPAEAFGTAMEAKDYSKPIKEMLDTMVSQIEGK
ncbi:MAG: extracellular solute-binding protein [Clostridiaceae bacterium]|jgi:arabinogalactan oligomer/maltooligosaccharide transport system substrate-binding protein|nr:extracellular solute-binding protein [Clostridiaceae bacterium]